MLSTAYVGVGSNIAPEVHVPAALELLGTKERITGVSSFYWTPAIGRPGQADYLNGVVRIETRTPPHALKYNVLRGVEAAVGRRRSADKYAPRCIDLDLLLYGARHGREDGLELPDPDLLERGFLLQALYDLAGEMNIPGAGASLCALLEKNKDGGFQEAGEFTKTLTERFGK